MTNQRLIYIANARLPTEKAHGFQICKMCEAFAQIGVEVQLWHPHRDQSDPKLQERPVLDYYGIRPIFQVKTLRNWAAFRLHPFLTKSKFMYFIFGQTLIWGLYAAIAARKEKADIYFTRDSTTAYWLTKLGLPTVYEAHAVPKRVQRRFLYRIARRRTLRLVVVLTSFIKKEFVKMGFPEEKVVVLADSVDLSSFADLPSREVCRGRLGLPLDRAIIGYVGRFHTLEMEKGIPELVQAMAHLRTLSGKEPLLLCVGGPMESVPFYLDLARRYGVPEINLRFVDRVPNAEVPLWIRAFDIALAPFPYTEHYAYFMSPLKLFEYLAAGVPVVATDLPSIREILEHGKNAWLVKPDDPLALAQGMHRLLENIDMAENLARQATRDVQSYTWTLRASEILMREQSSSLPLA